MAKRVFFSFHYQDVESFRVNVVRKHSVTKDREAAGFIDASIWERAIRIGPVAVKRLINDELHYTSVTCVLAGTDTYARPWVRYEILKSLVRNNSLLTVHINSIRDKNRMTEPNGPNPLLYVGVSYSRDGATGTLWQLVNGSWQKYTEIDGSADFQTNVIAPYRGNGFNLAQLSREYDWTANDGYNNFSSWVE
jgi:hypothetical protein